MRNLKSYKNDLHPFTMVYSYLKAYIRNAG